MGFFDSLIGGSVVTAVEGVANVVDKFVETDDEKRAWEQVKAKMAQEPQLAQIELNKVEASHRTMFVAGWRPMAGWICALIQIKDSSGLTASDVAEQNGHMRIADLLRGEQMRMEFFE